MKVIDAKAVARQWVLDYVAGMPGFVGAFVHGSANWMADDDRLPPTSDLDVMVVFDGATPAQKPGKLVERGVMLEVSYLSGDQLGSPDAILGQSDLAGSLHVPSVILDPTGRLGRLQAAVAGDYARRNWVRARCEHARDKVLRNLDAIQADAPFHDQFTSWLFGAGVTAHIPLVAGLRNPTVRTRYVAVRDLLTTYGRLDTYELLLGLLGCAEMDRERVERHLAAMTEAFDTAKKVVATPFFFAADISDLARPVAVDGSREMIARGDHREAVFWIAATYARCQKVLHTDGTAELAERHEIGFRALAADLGIGSFDDLQRRAGEVRRRLPEVWAVAEEILAVNPAVTD
ncbi:MAG: hypothetical protein IT336_13975 [Thermomicrobiales bacterium]|nr:hypothetical protein [Thermomicrobiales bacterium]